MQRLEMADIFRVCLDMLYITNRASELAYVKFWMNKVYINEKNYDESV